MPDSFEHMPTVAVQMPNGALASLAGNVDPHHRVAVADLILVHDRVRETVERLVRETQPDVVGLSVMTFQRRTAEKIIGLVRELRPEARIVVGGYDPSLAPEAWMEMPDVDFIVRGEGEVTLRELLRAIESGSEFDQIGGLTWRDFTTDRSFASGGIAIAPSEGEGCGTRSGLPDHMLVRSGLPDHQFARPGSSASSSDGDGSSVQTLARPDAFSHSLAGSSGQAVNWVCNPARPVHSLDGGEIRLPKRSARVLKGYHMLGRQVDVIETSRGCTFDCSFCSIIEMRGRNFHTYSFERVLADIADAREHGARSIFLVDDNITLNVNRFEGLCQAIVDAKLNDIDYTVQAMTSAIASHGETLGPLMRRAGFRYVFLGIENILADDLAFLKAAAKNADREQGRTVGNATLKAIDYIHRNKMYVVGGLIVGNPDDTRESIETNLKFAAKYVDWPYIQHPTPYPRTPMTKDFVARDLIINTRLHEYDGTTAVVKTESMSAEDIEYLRWRAERWMKTRHIPAVIRHDTGFVLTHWPKMLAHTFRGSSWKTALGLESDRRAFERYKARREREREYV